jgi:hypothetical protein
VKKQQRINSRKILFSELNFSPKPKKMIFSKTSLLLSSSFIFSCWTLFSQLDVCLKKGKLGE